MKLDQIGYWSEIKLEIIKKYAGVYTSIMSKQDWCKGCGYIDAFANKGEKGDGYIILLAIGRLRLRRSLLR